MNQPNHYSMQTSTEQLFWCFGAFSFFVFIEHICSFNCQIFLRNSNTTRNHKRTTLQIFLFLFFYKLNMLVFQLFLGFIPKVFVYALWRHVRSKKICHSLRGGECQAATRARYHHSPVKIKKKKHTHTKTHLKI